MECIRNQGWLSQVWSLQSDFDTEKFAPYSRSDGIFFSVGLTVTQNLKVVWDWERKIVTGRFWWAITPSGSTYRQNYQWQTRHKCVCVNEKIKSKSSAVDAIFVCCFFDEDVCCFRNLKEKIKNLVKKVKTDQNHSEAISTTRASRNFGKSVRWISIRLWSMKSQLIRASLFDSHIENARPKGFLFVSLPRGGIPASMDRPELNFGFSFTNYYVISSTMGNITHPCSPLGAATKRGRRWILARDDFEWLRQKAANK